jgi:ketosteroid isomerase-like protein
LRQRLTMVVAVAAILALAGCNGKWANNGGNGGGGGQGRNRPHATEDETRQAFEKVMGAIANRDTASLDKLMSSGAIFIDPPAGAGVFSWADAKPILEKSFSKKVDFQLSNEPTYRIGVERDLGWIATVYHVRFKDSTGEMAQTNGAMSMLFQKTEDGYKVLMLHASRFLPEPAAADTKSESGKKK